jgi:hypothetical protein
MDEWNDGIVERWKSEKVKKRIREERTGEEARV